MNEKLATVLCTFPVLLLVVDCTGNHLGYVQFVISNCRLTMLLLMGIDLVCFVVCVV